MKLPARCRGFSRLIGNQLPTNASTIEIRCAYRRSASLFALVVAFVTWCLCLAGLQRSDTISGPFAGLVATVSAEEETPLDPGRVRPLMEKFKAGETLTPMEQAYLDRARQQMKARASQSQGRKPGGSRRRGRRHG